MSDEKTWLSGEGNADDTFVSPYKKTNSIAASSDIICFDIYENTIYAAQSGKVSVFDLSGKHQRDFKIKEDVRDIVVDESAIYLLYPTGIEVFTPEGEMITGWQARRAGSDYCSMALSSEYIFVTDAGNNNICKYTKEGDYLVVIISPTGFIIPSYAFDIININDTIYCSNSGRHKIESYTLNGEFITSFGVTGTQAGAFPGCCNPVYLAATPWGDIITSEKGNPRISCYGRDGKYRTTLLNSKLLGGGTQAYRVKMKDDKIYVAARKSLSVFVFDPELAATSACAGCPSDCPLRQNQEK
jgi:hypothetical protein